MYIYIDKYNTFSRFDLIQGNLQLYTGVKKKWQTIFSPSNVDVYYYYLMYFLQLVWYVIICMKFIKSKFWPTKITFYQNHFSSKYV